MCTDCAINIHVCISCTHINIDEFVCMYTHARMHAHTHRTIVACYIASLDGTVSWEHGPGSRDIPVIPILTTP